MVPAAPRRASPRQPHGECFQPRHLDDLTTGSVRMLALPTTVPPMDEPLVLIRAEDGGLRCLSNVCTHRGALVAEGEGHVKSLKCRYHGRRYDPDTEVKRRAVFALSTLPKDESVPLLIRIARTHQNAAVRKQAFFWLGQSNDPRAVEFFAEILR